MSEDSPKRTRLLPLDRAKEVVTMQISIFPELLTQLQILSGRKPGLIAPIIDEVADRVSYDPMVTMTPEVFREFSGAPQDDARLAPWRESLYEQYEAKRKASRTT
jgi:hypothetical protein